MSEPSNASIPSTLFLSDADVASLSDWPSAVGIDRSVNPKPSIFGISAIALPDCPGCQAIRIVHFDMPERQGRRPDDRARIHNIRRSSMNPLPTKRYAWFTVGVLFLASVVSYLDRYVLSLFVGPIRHDLGLSDTQVSVLQGFAFALFYAVMGLPFGKLVDRQTRKNLIVVGIVVWSAMTILCGIGTSFVQLFVARMGVGIGEACLGPAAFSMIADSFDRTQRGRALASYNMSNYVGVGASLLLSGLVLTMVSRAGNIVVPGLGELSSWRVAFIVSALPGLVLAVVVFLLKEPARQEMVAPAPGGAAGRIRLLPYIGQRKRAFVPVYLVYALTALVGYIVVAWVPTFYIRHFHMKPADVGFAMGVLSIVAGVAGCFISGYVSDRFVVSGIVGGRFRIPLFWWGIAAVSIIGMTQATEIRQSFVFLGLLTFGSAAGLSSAPATIQDAVPNQLRGQASALHFIFAGLLGLSLGPTVVALVTDYVFKDELALGNSLVVVILPVSMIGFVVCWLGQRSYDTVRRQALMALQPVASGSDTATLPGSVGAAAPHGDR